MGIAYFLEWCVVVLTLAGMFWLSGIATNPSGIAAKDWPSGVPGQPRFWHMMFARAAMVAVFLLWIYIFPVSTRPVPGRYGPIPNTGHAPEWIAIFVIAANAIWAILHRLWHANK